MFNHHLSSLAAAALCLSSSLVTAQDSFSTDLNTYGQGDPEGTPYQTYFSNPNVKPPQLQINSNKTGLAPGYVFVGVDGQPTSGQNWPVIYDMSAERLGTLVWTANYTEPFDFKAQTYQGEPVITFFSGQLLNGYGHGSYYILNASYAEIAHFSAVGYENLGDLHEFTITPNNTALVGIYVAQPADLTAFGGSAQGYIFECVFQEIDIATNELLFEWKATEHVALNETYNELGGAGTQDSPFDWFHINSIAKDTQGNYLVSGRVMDCVYKIDGDDGHIIWRLHGKLSDFAVDDAANFAFQHDARWIDDPDQTRMTVFDNGPTDTVGYSRGLLLAVDQGAKTVSLVTEFTNGAKTFATYEGSVQALNASDPNANFFLGYGNQPFFAELSSTGDILLDVQFGKTNAVNGYRTYKLPWTGKPMTNPDILFNKTSSKVYFSWNGATDHEAWDLLTSNGTTSSATWNLLLNVTRTGFETEIDLSSVSKQLGSWVRGRAVDGNGNVLGYTQASNGTALVDAATDAAVNGTGSATSTTTSSSSGSATSASATATKKSAAVRTEWNLFVTVLAAMVVAALSI